MATGAVTQIKVLSKFNIPGGGRTATGLPSNKKTIVVGELVGAYLTSGGIGLNAEGGPLAFGLNTIDFIDFDVKSVAGTLQVDEALYNATYNHSTQTIFVCVDGLTKPTDADSCIIKFFAIGDSNQPDLV
jgi:hypothetical protein